MSELSNERLAEMLAGLEGVTPGPWGVWREPTFTMADAIRELTFQVESTPVEDFAKAVYLLDAGGKCPATTGCGPSSAANAAHIARCDPDTIRAVLTELHQRRASVVSPEMVERIVDSLNMALPHTLEFDAESGGYYDTDLSRDISALTAALSVVSHETGDGETQAVAVKPLEWIEYPNTHSPDVFGHFWDAETPFVRYTIEEVSGPDFESETPHYEVNRGRDCLICTKLSLLEAKAAAQDDYEQRSLYVLTLTDETQGVKRELGAMHTVMQRWRDEDHVDTTALTREQVIEVIEEHRAILSATRTETWRLEDALEPFLRIARHIEKHPAQYQGTLVRSGGLSDAADLRAIEFTRLLSACATPLPAPPITTEGE